MQPIRHIKPGARRVAFAFIDLETSHLDPAVGCILEVGALLCDADLMPLVEWSTAVQPSCTEGWLSVWSALNLDAELTAPARDNDPRATADEADATLCALLAEYPAEDPGRHRIAGWSPHYDLGWIRALGWQSAAHLGHRIWDISTLRAMDDLLGAPTPLPAPARHRALADCWSARDYARAHMEARQPSRFLGLP